MGKKIRGITPKTRQECPLSLLLFITVLDNANRQAKTIRGIRIGKQVKLSPFEDSMAVCLENPRNAIINLKK